MGGGELSEEEDEEDWKGERGHFGGGIVCEGVSNKWEVRTK